MSTETKRALPLGRPRLGSLWWAVLAFWVFLGFLIANQIFWGMLDHGHSWWRIFLWQAGAYAVWALFVPFVFALARRFPLEWKLRPFLVHVPAAVLLGVVHLVAVVVLALLLDPYRPVAEADSFIQEYQSLRRYWFPQDLILYAALLGLAALVDFRERHERRRLRESVLQAELARAELRALRLELQPHFIFNALNAVVALLRRGDPGRAERMVLGLSDLLRRTLDGQARQYVPLAEELRLTKLYLDIQQIRFGDRLAVALDTEPGTEAALVPGLLLQPLVENAVRHGVEQRSGSGRIGIHAQRDGERLILRVVDNGPGPVATGTDRGLGLDNVSSRLEAVYGDAWRLDLRPGTGGGAEVYIELPWREGEVQTDGASLEGDTETAWRATEDAGEVLGGSIREAR